MVALNNAKVGMIEEMENELSRGIKMRRLKVR
jgi:hypothetical protein